MIPHNSFRFFLQLVALIAISIPSGLYAEHKIIYTGGAGNRAIININGFNKILSRGQTSKDGVKLLSFNRNEAIIRVHGKRYRYKKKSKTGIQFADEITIPLTNGLTTINVVLLSKKGRPPKKKTRITPVYTERMGYYVDGFINGEPVSFLVDTGASHVALPLQLARYLRLNLGKSESTALTAGGEVKTYNITLDSVRVGDIEIKNVDALITPNVKIEIFTDRGKKDAYVLTALLGITFLKDLEYSVSEEGMTLEYIPP